MMRYENLRKVEIAQSEWDLCRRAKNDEGWRW